MRINKYIASSTGLSRRAADRALEEGRVALNGHTAGLGDDVGETDKVTLDGRAITPDVKTITIMFHKPVGYVVSRDGQGNKTIYDLLPREYHHLKPVGRLDKYSSGLLLLTNDGQLAHELTHPSNQKTKVYEVKLNIPLQPLHQQMISDYGIQLEDGLSKLGLERLDDSRSIWRVTMHEGRNRQIRRTFIALGYSVQLLHRISFGKYSLDIPPRQFKKI
jgi:23S rRNA pseudouridine2605 synthase